MRETRVVVTVCLSFCCAVRMRGSMAALSSLSGAICAICAICASSAIFAEMCFLRSDDVHTPMHVADSISHMRKFGTCVSRVGVMCGGGGRAGAAGILPCGWRTTRICPCARSRPRTTSRSRMSVCTRAWLPGRAHAHEHTHVHVHGAYVRRVRCAPYPACRRRIQVAGCCGSVGMRHGRVRVDARDASSSDCLFVLLLCCPHAR
jgi:hypothetical protein